VFKISYNLVQSVILSTFLISQGVGSLPREIEELINVEKKKGAIASLNCSFDPDIKLYFVDNVTFYPAQRGLGAISKIEKRETSTEFDPDLDDMITLTGPFYTITFAPPEVVLPKWPPIPLVLYRAGLPTQGQSVLSTLGLSNLCRSTGESALRQSHDDELETS